MKKTYITTMPNHIGSFLKASECFAELGINITRVSYNKAVDSHTLFIDAEGTAEQLAKADTKLTQIGYLQNNKSDKSVVLLEFCLRDVPGSVTAVLELINEFNFNIFPNNDVSEKTYQMNVSKVSEIIAWAYKNMGMLSERGFTVPLDISKTILGEDIIFRDDNLDDVEVELMDVEASYGDNY